MLMEEGGQGVTHSADWVGLAIVLVAAALIRLGWPGVNTFSYDEARLSQLALQMARSGDIPVVGIQSSAGIPNPPVSAWIMSLPFALSTDPLVASLFVSALNVAAVAGLWALVRLAYDGRAALLAGILYAASPFAAFYSRAIWSQDLLGPLAVAWALAGAHAASKRGGFSLAAFGFLTLLAPQVHYAGAALLIPAVWLVIHNRLWERWPALIAGACLAILAAVPFLLALWRAPGGGSQLLATALGGQVQADLTGLLQLLSMSIGRGWEWFLLGAQWVWPRNVAWLTVAGQAGSAALLTLGAVALLRDILKPAIQSNREARTLQGFVLLWALSAPLLFACHVTPTYHQYQLAALPATFIVTGFAVHLFRHSRWWLAPLTVSALVAIIQIATFTQGLDIVSSRLTPGGIGTPLAYPRAVERALADGGEIVVHAHGDQAEYVGDVAVFEVLLWDQPHRIVDGRSALLVPAQGAGKAAHLFFTFPDLAAAQIANALSVDAQWQQYPRREGEPPFLSTQDLHLSQDGWLQVEPVSLANGASLEAWRWEPHEDSLRVYTWWRITQDHPEGQYHQFHHLRTHEQGEPDDICDVPISSKAWRSGDTLIVWADLEMPREPAWVEVGMYTWPDISRSPILEAEGDPIAPIRLGPIKPAS